MQSSPLTPSEKDKVLEKLSLLHDEPVRKSELFQFDKFAVQLVSLMVDDKLDTPYAIAIHGEWGEGKTSLMGQARDLLDDKIKEQGKDWKVLWFDAWEYERLDPVAALLQRIAQQYGEGSRSRNFRAAIRGLALVFSDIVLRSATQMTLEEVRKHFESSIKQTPTISEKLSEMIGEGRLIVFVDDLDRCHVDNALGILEALKLFLNSQGAIFVVAVDMKKLERAWDLRYQGYDAASLEGKDHVDKIFQLKLSLPPKEVEAIKEYIRMLSASLPDNFGALIAEGCPPNPRKIKRILNLIYFLAKGTQEEVFAKNFPLIVIWSIATIAYPELARIISIDPNSLYLTVQYVWRHQSSDFLKFSSMKFDEYSIDLNIREPEAHLILPVLRAASRDIHLFNFLRSIAHYSILGESYPEYFKDIIYRAGLIG